MLNWIKSEFNRTYAVGDSQWCALVWHVGSDRFHYFNFVRHHTVKKSIKWTNQVHADVHTCPNMPVHAVLKEGLRPSFKTAWTLPHFGKQICLLNKGNFPRIRTAFAYFIITSYASHIEPVRRVPQISPTTDIPLSPVRECICSWSLSPTHVSHSPTHMLTFARFDFC
ncbi:unnamed protein product [Chondrus crispus]|uniref:Uncharacterized protein n=1 Tax=Chondrus crispus TaxID=2769 RepID=R7QRV9_CHOCR|nr:unnamed protein product [Chondrus crispus]CDF40095.1 unnamed protein product [Chondrus crispus]|eukprot:XP_005710389.1 unnamed protein product [Chondrus crispus]